MWKKTKWLYFPSDWFPIIAKRRTRLLCVGSPGHLLWLSQDWSSAKTSLFFGSAKTGLFFGSPQHLLWFIQDWSSAKTGLFFGSARTGLFFGSAKTVLFFGSPQHRFFGSTKTGLLLFFGQPRLVCSLVQPRLVCSLIQPRLVCCLFQPRLVSINSVTTGLGTGLTNLYSLYSTREYRCRFQCFCSKQRHRKINRQT